MPGAAQGGSPSCHHVPKRPLPDGVEDEAGVVKGRDFGAILFLAGRVSHGLQTFTPSGQESSRLLGDQALVLGLLNTLERELLPAIETGDAHAWSRANRIADGVLALLSDEERESIELPSRVGVLQALYTAAKTTREDRPARACALYTFVTRGREAIDPQRMSRPSVRPGTGSRAPASIRPPPHSIIPPPERKMPAWVPESGVLGGCLLYTSRCV